MRVSIANARSLPSPNLLGELELNWLQHRVPLSLNRSLYNKQEPTDRRAYISFKNLEITAEQLVTAIKLGYAQSSEFTGPRRSSHFSCAGTLALDFDGGTTIPTILQDLLVQEAATVLYTTCSHTEAAHRFRIIFFLESPIRSAKEFVLLSRYLAARYEADPRSTDAARLFRGNSNAFSQVFDRGLTSARVDELLKLAEAWETTTAFTDSYGSPATSRTAGLTSDQRVRVARGQFQLLSSLIRGASIHCPHHDDKNPSAVVLVNRHGKRGIWCYACKVSSWHDPEPFDFGTFDQALKHAAAFADRADPIHRVFADPSDPHYLACFPTAEDRVPLERAKIALLKERYLSSPCINPGVTLIKSPKGTGKSRFLEDLVASPSASVLLIGHRKTLIRSLCDRLGLSYYLDKGFDQRRVGVCLDSISKIDPSRHYDYVLVDESEQVLSHFMSKTMNGRRKNAMLLMRHILGGAKRVVALDADLGWPSFRFFASSHSGAVHMFLNEPMMPPSEIRLVGSQSQLTAELLAAIAAGKRCFVTANSKTLVVALHQKVAKMFPSRKTLAISSDNSRLAEVSEFVMNVAEKALEFDVILTSPTLATGIDITFENDAQMIDEVFGFFESNVTTHFECDQQIARVRHPKRVSVYISPARLSYETDLEVIGNDLKNGYLMESLILGYHHDGSPRLEPTSPLLDLATQVESIRRASLNELRSNFVAYREAMGSKVVSIQLNEALSRSGSKALAEGKEEAEAAYASALLGARRLSETEHDEALKVDKSQEYLSQETRFALLRTDMELFYRQEITAEIISEDRHGRLRDEVQMLSNFLQPGLLKVQAAMIRDADRSDTLSKVERSPLSKLQFLAEALRNTPIWNGSELLPSNVVCSDDLAGFISFMVANKARYETNFEKPLRSDIRDKPVSQMRTLLASLGLKIKEAGATTKAGKKHYRYALDSETLARMTDLMQRRSTDAWEALNSQNSDEVDNCRVAP